jgi:hypothetical protein
LGKSKIDVECDTPLAQKKAIPKEKLDNEVQAKVAAEAAVAAGNAEVERAELDRGWTRVQQVHYSVDLGSEGWKTHQSTCIATFFPIQFGATGQELSFDENGKARFRLMLGSF